MVLRKSLIPYHFGESLDIIPNRDETWNVIENWCLADRLTDLKDSDSNVVVSGDCMAAIGAHRNGLPLVWFDAHGDFHNFVTSSTCSIGGMVLAMLAGECFNPYMGLCGLYKCNDITHVGGSCFDYGELCRMEDAGVKVLRELDKESHIPDAIHLHIDLDVIGSLSLAAQFHPSIKGMRLAAFWRQMELCLPKTAVLSIKSYDPRKDHDGSGQALVLDLVRKFEELCP